MEDLLSKIYDKVVYYEQDCIRFGKEYFNDYNCGEPMGGICKRILKVYEENKVTDNFDVSMVTDFDRARNRICCKLINAERNAVLLADAPHVIIEDLAVVFFILATRDEFGTGTITIRNSILDMWNMMRKWIYLW